MTREQVLKLFPDATDEQITGLLNQTNSEVAREKEKNKAYKEKAGDELVKELQNYVKHQTAPYKYPRVIEFVDELPKTISGKIRRVDIRKKVS